MEIASLSQIAEALGVLLPQERSVWDTVKEHADSKALSVNDWSLLQAAYARLHTGEISQPSAGMVLKAERKEARTPRGRRVAVVKHHPPSIEIASRQKVTDLGYWFGILDHRVASMEWAQPLQTVAEIATSQNKINDNSLGLHRYTAHLPGESSPLYEGLQVYLGVHPFLRGHFIDSLLSIDQFLGKVESLDASKWTDADLKKWQGDETSVSPRDPKLLGKLGLMLSLQNADLYELLTDNESSWHTFYEAVQKELWNSDQPVKAYRVHINMTTINEMSADGLLGDIYLSIVHTYLQTKFGRENVVCNPENTSFLVIGSSDYKIKKGLQGFSDTIKTQLLTHGLVTSSQKDRLIQEFSPSVVAAENSISLKDIFRYGITAPEDLVAFDRLIREIAFANDVSGYEAFQRVGFDSQQRLLSVRSLNLDAVRVSQDRSLQLMAEALVFKAVMEMSRELASMTTFFEKERQSVPGGYSQTVFTARDLPDPSRQPALFAKWIGMKKSGVGFVGPGQYVPEEYLPADMHGEKPAAPTEVTGYHDRLSASTPEAVKHWIGMFPRYGRIFGQISHEAPGRRDSGNLSRRFLDAWSTLVATQVADGDFGPRLQEAKALAQQLRKAYVGVYNTAIQNPRYGWALKGREVIKVQRGASDTWVTLNAPVTAIAAAGNTYLGAMEFDSLKAFLGTHPSTEANDKLVMQAWDILFKVAHEMKMPRPVLVPGKGDHVTFSFASKNSDGAPIDPVLFMQSVQAGIAALYPGKAFQDLKKVEYYQIPFDLSGRHEIFLTREVLDRLKTYFNLNAEIRFHEVAKGSFMVEFPKYDQKGKAIDIDKIITAITSYQLNCFQRGPIKVENSRVKIWRKGAGRSESIKFGNEQPKGYSPYMRKGLTVTMALIDHNALRGPADIKQFHSQKEDLDTALEAAKYINGLDKQGFIDARLSGKGVVAAGESGGGEGGGGVGGAGGVGSGGLASGGGAANVDEDGGAGAPAQKALDLSGIVASRRGGHRTSDPWGGRTADLSQVAGRRLRVNSYALRGRVGMASHGAVNRSLVRA